MAYQDAYQIDEGYELKAEGTWTTGGRVRILHRGEFVCVVELPAALFATLARLIQAAQDAAVQEHTLPAFLPALDLAADLDRFSQLGQGDPNHVHKYVHRLRKALHDSPVGVFAVRTGYRFGGEVIERGPGGYRLSMPIERVSLKIFARNSVDRRLGRSGEDG